MERQRDAAPRACCRKHRSPDPSCGGQHAGEPYDQHFLARSEPVLQNRVATVPEAVRRMAEQKPRLTAVQKVEERNRLAIVRAQSQGDGDAEIATDTDKGNTHETAKMRTTRETTYNEASKYRTDAISEDENEELNNAIKEVARKWAVRTYDGLPAVLQQGLERGLDLRLDCIDAAYTAQLVQAIGECATRKLKEFEAEAGGKPAAYSGPAAHLGPAE
jgi:hypothetical protein